MIVTLTSEERDYFYSLAHDAIKRDRDIHITTGEDKVGPWVKVKVGGGMWTAPIRGERV